MSLHTIQRCDQCGAEVPYESIYATVGRKADAAGSMDSTQESVDLCPIHMRMLMDVMVSHMSHEEAAEWVRVAKMKRPPVKM